MAPRLRTAFVGIILVAYLLLVGPPALLLAWLFNAPTLLFRLAVPAARFGLWAAGVRIRVSGRGTLDAGRNYLFMPNHCSNVDPPVVVAALRRDTRMMAKASLFRIPIFGAVMRLAGFVPVTRDQRDAAISAVQQATERLRAGLDFVVFPEGTRSRDDRLLPLKKGPFFMALDGGAPVVPVRVSGSRAVMPRGGKVIHPGEITVEVLAPLEIPAGTDDRDGQRDELRRRVRAALEGDLTVPQVRVTPEE
ncbi:MAG: lysophospholipid acyltransferase family protein [Acidobacteriota bacterium]